VKTIVSACVTSAFVGALSVYVAASASAAPDVEGMTQEDAVAAIEEDGGIPKVSVDVYYGPDEGEVLLTLNCNRGVATATTPGSSAASVSGREFQAKAEEQAAAAQSEEGELAEAGELPGVPDLVAGE
jgi:hypothetical protein